MHIPAIIKTSQGPRLLPRPPMMRITVTPNVIEREAAEAQRELRFSVADRLSHRALVLRATAP